jgi:hypothetical protein
MTEDDRKKVISLFGAGRDGYAKPGMSRMAAECEEDLGLVQQIALGPRL